MKCEGTAWKNGEKRGQPELGEFFFRVSYGCAILKSIMPRRKRCVLPGVPCHITQRGVDRRETFSSDTDRRTYLEDAHPGVGGEKGGEKGVRKRGQPGSVSKIESTQST